MTVLIALGLTVLVCNPVHSLLLTYNVFFHCVLIWKMNHLKL